MIEVKDTVPVNLTSDEAAERRFPELDHGDEAMLIKAADDLAIIAAVKTVVKTQQAVADMYASLRKAFVLITAPGRLRNQNPRRPDRTVSGMPFKRGKGKSRW